jgi:hypothetical protein
MLHCGAWQRSLPACLPEPACTCLQSLPLISAQAAHLQNNANNVSFAFASQPNITITYGSPVLSSVAVGVRTPATAWQDATPRQLVAAPQAAA